MALAEVDVIRDFSKPALTPFHANRGGRLQTKFCGRGSVGKPDRGYEGLLLERSLPILLGFRDRLEGRGMEQRHAFLWRMKVSNREGAPIW